MLRERKITTYMLIKDYNMGRSLIDKLKHDKGLTTSTIDKLCNMFHCEVNDILEYIDENKEYPTLKERNLQKID